MKFFIKTLGCKVNQYDSIVLKRKLLGAGFLWSQKNPDLVIVNTCAVTKNAIRKDRQTLKSLQASSPMAKFVLMGCFPQTYFEEMKKFKVDLVWGTGKLEELAVRIEKIAFGEKEQMMAGRGKILKEKFFEPPKSGERSRYFLKIQDGCEQFCSYCNIPFARGKLASRGAQEIIAETEQAIQHGFGEIVLCGIHLGLYGKEKNSHTCNLVELLAKLVQIKGLGRIRLSSIEVNDVSVDLLKLMAKSGKICEHLHLPLQSGNDRILKLMNRPYGTAEFEEVVLRARKLVPGIAITTDIIVGFPGEGDNDFKSTFDFVKKIKFSKLHVFPFSAHEKTPAAKMEGKVPQEKIKTRAEKLRKEGKAMETEFLEKFLDKQVEIVVEKKHQGFASGKERCYFDAKVEISDEKFAIGSLRKGIMICEA